MHTNFISFKKIRRRKKHAGDWESLDECLLEAPIYIYISNQERKEKII